MATDGRGRPSQRWGRREREINLGKSVLRLPGPARDGRRRRRENAPLSSLQPLRLRFGCTARCSATAKVTDSHTLSAGTEELQNYFAKVS